MSGDKPKEQEVGAKQAELSADDIDSQAAVELPNREAMTLIQPEPIFGVTPTSPDLIDPGWGGERI